jgi:hypothetical protein
MSTIESGPASIQAEPSTPPPAELTHLGRIPVDQLEKFDLESLYPNLDHQYGATRFDKVLERYGIADEQHANLGRIIMSRSLTPGIEEEQAVVRSLLLPDSYRRGGFYAVNTIADGESLYGHTHRFVSGPRREVPLSPPAPLLCEEAELFIKLGRADTSSVVNKRRFR